MMSEVRPLMDIRSATDTDALKYIFQLKSLYRTLTPTNTSYHQWPPPATKKVLNLAMIEDKEVRRGQIEDSYVRMTITGKMDDILRVKSQIKLTEIFKELNNAKQPGKRNVILMEGAPGCGKSTLSMHISQQWGEGKLFQEFEAVILVRLRDPVVQSAKSVTDLFPSSDDSTVTVRQVIDKMHTNKFESVLFILDGWDELPTELRDCSRNSIFLDLIKPDLAQINGLEGSTVIVTSRPIASGDLYSLVSLRIEILGFTPTDLKEYFTECLDGDTDAVKNLTEKIDENPAIAGTCSLPLNASILAHLYKDHPVKKLPTSQYGIFSLLICTCVSRHLKERTVYKNVSTFESLDQILATDVTAEQFKSLCKLAYDGVMKNEVTFSADVDSLSLLQGVESLINKGMSYNFIHLSIQEVLAAFYMTEWLTESEQIRKFEELIDQPRFSAVFQFYAAISKLKLPGIHDIINKITTKCCEHQENPDEEEKLKTHLVSLLNCLNEAQDQSLCELITKHLQNELNLGHKTVIPADCLSIGYFLSNICKSNIMGKFQVSLFNCSIDDECCKYLVKGLQTHLEIAGKSTTVLDMDLSLNCIGKEGGIHLSKLLQLGCVGALRLNGNRNLSDIGAKYISEQLSTNSLLKELGVYDCGVTTNTADDIATALMTNRSLKVLNIGGNAILDAGVQNLANTLKYNQNLESLNLACCGMTDVGLQSLVDSLRQNTSLKALKFYNFVCQEHPNKITDMGNAVQELFSCLKKHPTLLTLVLPMEFMSSLKDIREDTNDARKKGEMAPIKLQVEGHTLTEIKRAEEEKNKATHVQSQDQKSESFHHAEERAKVPFLHHEVLECDHRGLTHTISDHDITLRIPEGAVSEGDTVHFEVGVSTYGPFQFPENNRPISPIIWICLLEKNYELQEMFEFSLPHFLTYLTEQRIRHLKIRFAKAYHKGIKEEGKKFNTDCVYNFHLLDSQPLFVSKNKRDFAILASKHCCFLCLLAPDTRELAEAAGYCLVRIEPLPNIVCFSATFFYKPFINSLKCRLGDRITHCRKFKFRKNEEKEPYIRMVIPSDSEYPTEVKVARDPTDLIIRESEIDFWKHNQDRDYIEFIHEMQTYPPQLVVVLRMDPSLHSYKLPIKFEGCEENLDTELMFPLENPVLTPLMLSENVCMANTSNASLTNKAHPNDRKSIMQARTGVKRSRTDSDEHTQSSSKVLRCTKPASSDETERVSQILESENGSGGDHSGTVHPETTGNSRNPKTLGAQPIPKDLVLIKYKDEKGEEIQLRIKESICNKWKDIGHLFKIKRSRLKAWATEYRDKPLDCIEEVMDYWFENPTAEYPVSWKGLKDLLNDIQHCKIAEELEKALKQ